MCLCLIALFDIGDQIAKSFHDTWTALTNDFKPKEREITDRIIPCLAVMMRPLLVHYNIQKRTLRILLRDMSGFGRDYDNLRSDDINPRDFICSSSQKPENQTKILEVLDDLESTASGLLILLRPEFFHIALSHPYNCIPEQSPFSNLLSIEEEERKRIISNLRAQETYSAVYKENSVELLELLCEKGCGPWKESRKGESLGKLVATAVNLLQITPQPWACFRD